MTRSLALLTSIFVLASCGADDSLGATSDTSIADAATPDTAGETQGADTSTPDTTVSETASDASADTREVEAPLTGFKDDPTYLVPGNVAAKTDVAAAGDRVAWVEGGTNGSEAPILVVWDVSTPAIGPRAFAPANLLHPRALALSDAYLVYVDDRYGDPDVFAIDLATGLEIAVVNRPGAQEAPAVFGSRVAWEDCTSCVTGDGVPGHEPLREVVERDLAGGDEVSLTSDGLPDRAPSYGLLADGRPALAWISGRTTLRMERLQAGVSATVDVQASLRADAQLGRVAIWDGLLAWRPSPLIVNPDSMIVNPDSMYPSDVLDRLGRRRDGGAHGARGDHGAHGSRTAGVRAAARLAGDPAGRGGHRAGRVGGCTLRRRVRAAHRRRGERRHHLRDGPRLRRLQRPARRQRRRRGCACAATRSALTRHLQRAREKGRHRWRPFRIERRVVARARVPTTCSRTA